MSDFASDFERRLRQFQRSGLPMMKVAPVLVLLVLGLILVTTAWVTVNPEEKGVVLRLGKYHRTMDPGLNFKMPFGAEQVLKVPVTKTLKQEFGFKSVASSRQVTRYSQENFDHESIMVTGDLNVADVEWVTQYHIKTPRDYLFKVRNLEKTFRDMNQAIMREVIGDHTINEILTTGRIGIEVLVKQKLQELCDQYEMGVGIDQVILQDVNPPALVKPAFNVVNQAQQEKERMINQAQQEYNKIIPKARGDASKMEEEAQGYAVERVNRAKGEADRFNALFQAYAMAPEVTRQRIYLETMEQVLGKVGRKIIMDSDGANVLPLLNLNQEGK